MLVHVQAAAGRVLAAHPGQAVLVVVAARAADAARRAAIAKGLQPANRDGLPAIESSVTRRHDCC